MEIHSKELEQIATSILSQHGSKPGYSNRDFFNTLLIFNCALVDKIYDNQDKIGMGLKDRVDMVQNYGTEMRDLILKYTGIDTFQVEHLLTT